MNTAQKVQNPYYANPFFRPKMVMNPSATTSNAPPASSVNRESSVVTTTIPFQTSTTSSVTNTSIGRGKSSIYPQPMNPHPLTNGRLTDSETTVMTSSSTNQEDPRRWAQSVGPASIARRALNDERLNGALSFSTANVSDEKILFSRPTLCSNRPLQRSVSTHRNRNELRRLIWSFR